MRDEERPRVLIVAEDRIDGEDMAVLLSHEMRCDVLTDRAAALEALRSYSHDLAIVDMDLQTDVDGVQILSELRKTRPELPIVMLSATGESPGISEGFRLGACHCLLKGSRFLIRDTANVARLAIENARLRSPGRSQERVDRRVG